jgi:serine/threonine protein kinase
VQIGRYRVLGRLGRGGMGSVYKVVRDDLGKMMALKVLAPHELLEQIMGAEEVRRQFIHEARLMARREHRNIATVWDLGEDDGRHYMAMEYFCMNLGTLIGESPIVEESTRPLPPLVALDYTRQTLEGLARLHHDGIQHRDIKPFNLMLSNDGVIKIIDLGLSRLRGEAYPTPGGLKVGSPYYAAPEQEADADSVDERADLYSAAVLLYRLITGDLPETGGPIQEHPLLSGPWHRFFTTALAANPGDRFSSARTMIAAANELEEEWRERQENTCSLFEPPDEKGPPVAQSLRHRPVKTGVTRQHPFPVLDPLFRPHRCVVNRFLQENGMVRDEATGLVWLAALSDFPMSWPEVPEYLEALAVAGHAKDTAWRLPTVDELVTLLQPRERLEDFCSPDWFAQGKPWIWSADRRSFTSAWFVDVVNGAVMWQDTSCRFHVLAVAAQNDDGG